MFIQLISKALFNIEHDYLLITKLVGTLKILLR